MKQLLATTALVALAALPVAAQTASTTAAGSNGDVLGATDFVYTPAPGEMPISAAELIGKRIYTAETRVDATAATNDADPEWNDIGEISDVLIGQDGALKAILVDVGGFLGVGEKTVAVAMDQLKLVADGDDAGDYFVVFTASREQLDNAPAYEVSAETEMGQAMGATAERVEAGARTAADTVEQKAGNAATALSDAAHSAGEKIGNATDAAKAKIAAATGATAGATTGAAASASGAGMKIDANAMTAGELEGAPVFDANDRKIGEIDRIVAEGGASEAVIDVGGFLGIGSKPVAVSLDALEVEKSEQAGVKILLAQTEEQIKAMPAYTE